MIANSCAFTGHRPQKFSFGFDESHPDCVRLKKVLEEQIQMLYKKGVTEFYTGGAMGVDQWAADIVLELMKKHSEIHLRCIIPHEEQPIRWSEDARNRYFQTLADSTEMVLLNTKYVDGCFFQRNRYLVDHAGILVAVYDHLAENKKSGTGYTVRYATMKGRDILLIHPETAVVTFAPKGNYY